ncbi:hypothetical protein [Microbacterium thalli]|uniref:Uncharacterized protein n=1 Tax=Microbacterium thalli TaxID=3027921 RepID=A0ABT5SKI1_9MICO|nr:hypothetical protein [Microbacterium thalli]MDD7963304.1 hypothetical protein [Microbacterium thalli]
MISASLIGGKTPPMVRVLASDTPAGVPWRMVGTDGVIVWVVPGGEGIGDGGQLTLFDNRSTGNRPIVYSLIVDGVSVDESNPVVVPFRDPMVIQSLDGQRAISVKYAGNELPQDFGSGQALFRVPGRARPVVRYGATSDVTGRIRFRLPVEQTEAVRELFAPGESLLFRTDGSLDDLPPVGVFAFGDISSVARSGSGKRLWQFSFTLVDDPYMDQRLGAFTWDYIDALQVQGTTVIRDGDAMEQLLAGLTWDEIDAFDWSVVT